MSFQFESVGSVNCVCKVKIHMLNNQYLATVGINYKYQYCYWRAQNVDFAHLFPVSDLKFMYALLIVYRNWLLLGISDS